MYANAIVVCALLCLVGCSSKDAGPAQAGVPEKLAAKGKDALIKLRGKGVQIYVAEEKDGKLQWVFRAPRATLHDPASGDQVGSHGAGPTWIDNDGGKLTGKMIASEPSPKPDAIPWLLLEVVKAENGGRFAKVTHIQRLDTSGGRAPATMPGKAGESVEVPYEATYVFLGSK